MMPKSPINDIYNNRSMYIYDTFFIDLLHRFFPHFNLILILMFFFKKYYIKNTQDTIYLRYIIKKLEIH